MWIVWCSCTTGPHAQMMTGMGLLSLSFPLAILVTVVWGLVSPLSLVEECHGCLPKQRHVAASYQFLHLAFYEAFWNLQVFLG
jgi:hypothetical protein